MSIFPAGALDSSVITTVWVGVMVVAFFNLRLGWVLSGLVVPGYLVPLLLVKPVAAGVTFGEGVLTYGLIWFYSEYLSRYLGWSNLFGRDRFFALVLASVAVRLVADGWALPELAQYLGDHFQLRYDYRNNLHSFGLIIVALIANNFWKTGLRAGLLPMIVTIGLTLLIVRYGLMAYTNFSIGNLSYMYEDFASSILASPKSYIILLTTAFLASRMNLHYGWDFSGILIPSLLALQWYQPFKILTSFSEALLIVLFASLALRLPVFRRMTMEGARKLMLFFNISFLYKLIVGHVLVQVAPQISAVDYFGFGYLLPTLIAIKMHDKGILVRLTRATLQTSLTAVAVASVIGFGLTLLPPLGWWSTSHETRSAQEELVPASTAPLIDAIRADKLNMYASRLRGNAVGPTPGDLAQFSRALTLLDRYLAAPSPGLLAEATALLDSLNYALTRRGQYLYLAERAPRRGWGSYVLNTRPGGPLAIEVPLPFDEAGTLEGGAGVFIRLEARSLAFGGISRRQGTELTGDVLANQQLFFHAFHQVFGRRAALQLRGDVGLRNALRDSGGTEPAAGPSLWIKRSLPDGLDLPALKALTGAFDVRWQAPPLRNVQRAANRGGFAELYVDRPALRKLQSRALVDDEQLPEKELDRTIDGYLQDWLLGDQQEIAPAGSNLYVVPRMEQLLYLDEEIVTPLLATIATEYGADGWSPDGLDQLREINRAAATLGYEVIRYRQRGNRTDYLLLAERAGSSPRKYWGSFVFRLGTSTPYLVQVPRPLFETNSFEFAVALFARLNARVLLIAGAHPAANDNYSADLVRFKNKANAFNLVNQVVLREAGPDPMMVLQSRAYGLRPDTPAPEADVLLALDRGAPGTAGPSALAAQIYRVLDEDRFSIRYVDGAATQVGYEIGGLPQALYLQATSAKEFGIAWVSPAARRAYRQQTDNRQLEQQFTALAIPTVSSALLEHLAGRHFTVDVPPPGMLDLLASYWASQDIVALRALQTGWPAYRLERVLDLNSRQAFLLVYTANDELLLIANLAPRDAAYSISLTADDELPMALTRLIDTRAAMLRRAAP